MKSCGIIKSSPLGKDSKVLGNGILIGSSIVLTTVKNIINPHEK
jgi:hypothetical protein